MCASSSHWVPSRGRSESAALGVCMYIKTLYTHTLRVLPIHFGRETVPSGSSYCIGPSLVREIERAEQVLLLVQ